MSARRTEVREECLAGQRVLRRISDKWSCLLLAHLVEGAMHFNELRRSLKGISQWSLTRALRGLVRDGMVSRMTVPTIPPRVDYDLTDLGRSLVEHLRALGAWALKEEPAILQARKKFDEHASSRSPQCGTPLSPGRARTSRVRSGS